MYEEDKTTSKNQEWEQRVAAELQKRQPSSGSWGNVCFAMRRVYIRSLRIAGGGCAAAAAAFLFDKAGDVLGKPFAVISPLDLLGAIFLAGGSGLYFAVVALWIAFGKGKSREQTEAEDAIEMRAYVEAHLREEDEKLRQRVLARDRMMRQRRWVAQRARRLWWVILGRGYRD